VRREEEEGKGAGTQRGGTEDDKESIVKDE